MIRTGITAELPVPARYHGQLTVRPQHSGITAPSVLLESARQNCAAGVAALPACCARLRTIGSRRTRGLNRLANILHMDGRFGRKSSICSHDGRHEKPARTQCLTSAADCLCSHPNFCCTALADPKARFCRSLASQSTIRHRETRLIPLTLKALNTRMLMPAARAAWLSSGPLKSVPLRLVRSRRAVQFPPHPLKYPEWAEKTRNDYRSASRLGLASPGQ